MPAQFTLPPDTRAVGTGNPPADVNAHTDALAAVGATFSVLNAAYSGGADPTGVADSTAAINAADVAAAATGGIVTFPAGTFKVTGLVKQASSIWQGAGRNQTTIQLANGANTDVVQGANFSTLTLSGSIGGIGGWGIRDLTIDGNKANQSGTSNGLRVYGYNWDLYNVTIRNCLTEGLTTEWSVSSGAPAGPDSTMEARIYGVKIYNCGATGWHDRGPHDSRTFDLTIFSNGATFPGYWAEGATATTVAAGSNGVVVSTFAGAGTLNVASTLNYPAASINSTQGSLTLTGLTGGTGTCVITYTGTTATTFTGCTTVSGSGTLATGNPVTMTGGGYSAAGMLMFGGHTYGPCAYGFQLDTPVHLIDCVGEVATTAVALVRSQCKIIGGLFFVASGASQTGCGIQLGDAANGASKCYIRTSVERFACTSAATAALNIVLDSTQNDVEINAFAPAGSVVWSGTRATGSRFLVRATGQSTSINAANSTTWDASQISYRIPDNTSQALTFQDPNGFVDAFNINTATATPRVEGPNGYEWRLYSDAYTTPTVRLIGALGHVGTAVKNGTSMSIAAAAGAGTSPPAPTLLSASSDTQGQASLGTGTTPAAGAQATVTFANAFTAAPIVVITAANALTSALQPYVTTVGTGSFQIAFNVAPAGSQATGIYLVNYIILARPN